MGNSAGAWCVLVDDYFVFPTGGIVTSRSLESWTNKVLNHPDLMVDFLVFMWCKILTTDMALVQDSTDLQAII